MRNLKIWQKLVLLGVVFFVPFGIVTRMAASIDTVGVEFARQEIRGLDYYSPLSALLNDLQQHRDLVSARLSGDASVETTLAAKRADVERGIQAVDEADRRLGTALSTSEKWTAWGAAWRGFAEDVPKLSAAASFQQHTKLIEDLIALITEVGDHSNLTLDPEIDSYYLMNIIIFQGPELREMLSQARGLGSSLAVYNHGTLEQVEKLNRLSTLVQFLQRKVDQSLGKAFEFNAALKQPLEAPAETSAEAVQEVVGTLSELAGNRGESITAVDYDAAITLSTDSVFHMETQATEALNGLLLGRIEKFRNGVLSTLAWAALSLLITSAIGFIIMRDVAVPLRQVADIANRMATGDLRAQAGLGARKDEIGTLAKSFELMAMTLSGLLSEVHKSGLQLNSSTIGIAATAREQQATASEVAATTSQIGATSREISATSRELFKTMTEVAAVAEGTAALAGHGQTGLFRMEETMGQVMEAAGSINAKLAVLNEKAGNINQVVTTIAKVADQTNLLSLNAAIEAEKAGEYGRGFAAVAAEIRRLADQTAVATYDIEQMVKEIQSAVSAGVMGMDKFSEQVRRGMHDVQEVGGQLSQIIQQVQALVPRIETVNEGMNAQATGAEQISEALLQLTDAAQQTVDSLSQSTMAIDELNQVSGDLRSGVSRFKLEAA